jgi:Resolvase, N terminal domain
VVYKVDRLTRSLADFAKLVELFDRHHVSFVSVTQQFNTTTSMGRQSGVTRVNAGQGIFLCPISSELEPVAFRQADPAGPEIAGVV